MALSFARLDAAAEADNFDAYIDRVCSVYQPIVALETGQLVGFEALARGPAGTPLARPDRLFAAAREAGQLCDLDRASQASAVQGAMDHGIGPPLSLFVNVEPETLGTGIPQKYADVMRRATQELSIVLEVTERALIQDPARLLRGAAQARARGCTIALDDVGADPSSLALMPFLRPEIIKLDLQLVQQLPSAETAAIMHSVLAETERTGAVVLAEGIETSEHLAMARVLGARYGQGWFFGRPQAIPTLWEGNQTSLPEYDNAPLDVPPTPFDLVRDSPELRPGSRQLLLSFSRHLERQAHNLWEPPVVLATFQDAKFFTPATKRRYESLAKRASFVVALGTDMPLMPGEGVRGTSLRGDDPLCQEWTVTVVGPHFAGALIARQLHEGIVEGANAWSFLATYCRETVLAAMRSLMGRVAPV